MPFPDQISYPTDEREEKPYYTVRLLERSEINEDERQLFYQQVKQDRNPFIVTLGNDGRVFCEGNNRRVEIRDRQAGMLMYLKIHRSGTTEKVYQEVFSVANIIDVVRRRMARLRISIGPCLNSVNDQ